MNMFEFMTVITIFLRFHTKTLQNLDLRNILSLWQSLPYSSNFKHKTLQNLDLWNILSSWHSLPYSRHGVNSIPKLELMDNSNPIPELESELLIWQKIELELKNLALELKFTTKKLNPQMNVPFNFLIEKYFFNDNPNWNINSSE